MNLLIIDGIGPFFRHYRTKRINWSKVPFSHIETGNGIREDYLRTLPEDFARLVRGASAVGYNAVTLDDVAHLSPHAAYPPPLNRKIDAYRRLYARLFEIACAHSMRVFLTTDVMYYNAALRRRLGRSVERVTEHLAGALDTLFAEFQCLAGIIVRFGEQDGRDVSGDFESRMVLRRPADARAFVKGLLPVFERHNRLFVFRTWSVGAYQIGDLMWNADTYDRVFDGISSRNLAVSMKYGESDFFRYLPLNRLFARGCQQKIIEFQARREYEGFGAYPSFVGWDVERYLRALGGACNLIGASVWCQTGGWGRRRQLTYVRNSSPWVELNAEVIAALCRGASCEEAVASYCARRTTPLDTGRMLEFLRMSEEVIHKLLYMSELGERTLFFRRLRLPPQLHVFWDRVIVNHTVKRILKCLVTDRERCIREGWEGLATLQRMRAVAETHGLPRKGLDYQLATYRILATAREYFFRPYSRRVVDSLHALAEEYRARYRRHYSVMLDFRRSGLPKVSIRWFIRSMLRDHGEYSWKDQVLTLRLVSWIYPMLRRWQRRAVPSFAAKQTMGIDAFLK